jgi:predicted AAA+ superfamily ATPase
MTVSTKGMLLSLTKYTLEDPSRPLKIAADEWEHLVLDILRTVIDDQKLFYWRDKSGREIDLVIKGKRIWSIPSSVRLTRQF